MRNNCPYCLNELPKIPQRKTKCPFCSKFIHVKTDPKTNKRDLVTEKKAKEIDEEWNIKTGVNKWMKSLEFEYGITKKNFVDKEKFLFNKHGRKPNGLDVIWQLFNDIIMKTKDYQSLKMIYYQMALLLNEEGRDCYKILLLSKKMELLRYKEEGLKEIQIITCKEDSCDFCKPLENKVINIDEALRIMPLPNRYCTKKLSNDKFGFCRCLYTPINRYLNLY